MRKPAMIAGVLLVVIAATYFLQSAFQGANAGKVDWPLARVTRDTLIESSVATGTVKPRVGAEVKVGSQLSGVVAKLYVNVGDKVVRGAPLALLNDSQWRARTSSLKSDLNAAIAESEYAAKELSRLEGIFPNISAAQVDDGRRSKSVREAAVARIKAQLVDAELQLSYTKIVAPISGTIASISTFEGETVAASFAAPTFVVIVDLDRLEIQTFVDEADIGKVRIGQPVAFRVTSYPNDELNGVVRAIYPKAQIVNNVVNYIVIVDIDDTKGLQIRPEMTARVTFILEKKQDVSTIPRSALLREGAQEFVIVPSNGGWAKKSVSTGMKSAQRLEILSNLAVGDTVLSNAQLWKDLQSQAQ